MCTSRDTSRVARALKRAIIAGLNLSGVHVMDLELSTVPRHPLPGAQRAGAGRDLGAARARRSRQRRDPLLRRDRRRHRRGAAAQARAPAVPRRLPAGVRRRHRRHHVPAPRARVLHGRARGERRRRAAPAAARSRSCSTTRSARRRSSCRTCSARSARRCSAVNPYAATVGATVDDLETRVKIMGDLVRTSGSDLGLVFDPDGETAVIIDDEGDRAHRRPGAARDRRARVRDAARTRSIALPVSVSREAERIARAARRDGHLDEAVGRAPHGGRAAARRSTSRRRRRAASSGRRSCPPTTRPRRSRTCSTCSRATNGRCRRSSPACPTRTSRTKRCRRRGSARAR